MEYRPLVFVAWLLVLPSVQGGAIVSIAAVYNSTTIGTRAGSLASGPARQTGGCKIHRPPSFVLSTT